MNLPPQRQGKVWAVLCGLMLLITLAAKHDVSRGASTSDLPVPVNVPIPDAVFHTDNYGESMAIDGDTLVVGAPWTVVNGADQQGVAYIFTRTTDDPTAFTLLKSITGSDSTKSHAFGWSVDIHGDTLVIGTGNNGNINFPGAAYVFQRNQGGENNWGEVKKLVRGDDKPLTWFGRTLAIQGDTIAVGAPLGLGQVLIYQRDQNGANQWGKTQTLDGGIPITTTPRSASFGHVIAFDGDRLVISAPKIGLKTDDVPPGSPTPPRNFEGATLIYRQENGQWLREARLFSSDLDLDHLDPVSVFGGTIASLALNGDLLFVSTPLGTTNGVMAGKVFVYQRGAGTLSPFGQPGEWGEIAQLSPSDGVANDHFGRALYAADDGIFVSSEKQGVGKVYFFRNPAGQASVNAAAPQAALQWREVYSFSTSLNGSSTEFGLPLTGSANTVVIGDQAANSNRGGVSAYPKDALFAVDPHATPVVTPTATVPPLPAPLEPCVATNRIFLPLVAGGLGSATGAATSSPSFITQPLGAATPFVGVLGPDCIVTGPGGVKVGAVSGALTSTLAITIVDGVLPVEPLPATLLTRGDYFRINAARNKGMTIENPLLIGVPVPASADKLHLALAYQHPAADILDTQAQGEVWNLLPGVYDAQNASLFAKLPFVTAAGTTFVLVESPDLESPPNAAAIQASAATTNTFTVACALFTKPTDCTLATENQVAAMLDAIYQRMTQHFSFTRPRILDHNYQVIVTQSYSVTSPNLHFDVFIYPSTTKSCKGAAGYYERNSGSLVFCYDPTVGIDSNAEKVMVHEYFHATQYAYAEVWDDYDLWKFDKAWIIEGMATATMESYYHESMQRTFYFGENELHKVDIDLRTGKWGDEPLDEYLAQDFWVYLGQHELQGLAMLGTLLDVGGATSGGMIRAIQATQHEQFADLYWAWVKNQVIENTINTGGPGETCKLSEEALSPGAPVEFPASETFFPFNTQSAYDTLPPLTAKVIEINFANKASALVQIEYQGCAGLQDPLAKASCVAAAQQTLKSKIYVEGEASCQNEPLQSFRFLSGLSPSNRYFVVVANADPYNDQGYFITIE